MKIISIVPGFGGTFYCGNCLRDSAFVDSMRKAGHQAIILPMYLPLTMNGEMPQEDIPVFYGAVNIYLKQQFPFLRKMPAWLEKLFNSKSILRFAAKKSGSTRATGLEELTESMLLGSEGNQSSELQQLVDFLVNHEKPDIVHFSNALLLGMAKQVKEQVKVPVVVSLQDEDVWVDVMEPAYREKIWNLLAEKARDVDAFISVSNYFAGKMKEKLSIPTEKLHVLHIGINPDLYSCNVPASDPQAIGYLSRICEENGFHLLVDAFIRLKAEPRFRSLKLRVTGGMTGDDKKFIQQQLQKLKIKNLEKEVEFFPDFSLSALKSFFKSVTVLSVPVLNGEAFGLYQLEALASGIPLVQPRLGAFPEIIQATRGGRVYSPNTAEALAKELSAVLSDQELLLRMSQSGHEAIRQHFDCGVLASKMADLYMDLISTKASGIR